MENKIFIARSRSRPSPTTNPSLRGWKRRADDRKYEEYSPKFPTYDLLASWHSGNRDDRIRRETFNCTRRLGKRSRIPATPLFHQSLRGGTSSCQTSGNLYAAASPSLFRRRSRLPSAFKQVCYSNFAKKVSLKHARERIICRSLES